METRHEDKQPKKRRRGLVYTLSALGVLVFGGAVFGYWGYSRLQPKNHFNHVPTISTSNAEESPTSATTTPGTFNALLIGTDTRPGQGIGHSDSMILVHVNLNRYQYNLLSIPRDTRVPYPPYGHTKLTSIQYMDQTKYGTKTGIIDTVQEISSLTGVPINYYTETNYWGLQDIVDALGGINVDLPFTVKLTHAWYPENEGKIFTKGNHFLSGQMTTEVVHERYSVPGTDYGRQQLQEAALIGIVKELMKPKNVSKIPSVLKVLPKYLVATNMTKEDMMSILLGAKGNFDPASQIHYYQVKGTEEVAYNDVLKAKDDEVILQPGQLKNAAKMYLKN